MVKDNISPLVSIGMPTYNGENTIERALDSLLSQDFKDFELIICDNVSTDNTEEICKQYAIKDPRIRYYRNEKNIYVGNMNRLLSFARGKYFMWAADDDLWESSFITEMVNSLDNNPDAVLSFCRFDHILSDKPLIIYRDEEKQTNINNHDKFHRLLYTFHIKTQIKNVFCIYGLMRRDLLLECGGYEMRVNGFSGSDKVTLFNLLTKGKFIKVNKLLFHTGYNSDRHSVKESHCQLLSKKPLYYMLKSGLNWIMSWHQHYRVLRIIVKDTSLQTPKKIILFIMLYLSELLFYFTNLNLIIIMLQAMKIKINKSFRNI